MKIAIALLVLIVIGGVFVFAAKRRPKAGALAAPAPELVTELRRDVEALCAIGQRNVYVPENIHAAAGYIERQLAAAGYEVERQSYVADGVRVDNLIVELRGRSKDIVVIGAHYDSVSETPGADDNASGAAALLALARRFAKAKPEKTLRFVAFANEEPPHFQSKGMGSWQYAKRCHDRKENIAAMVSLETIGYYDDRPGSQQYPAPLSAIYPNTGNFIAFAANIGSRGLMKQSVKAFRKTTPFPAESGAFPEAIPGIGWSDQWSFWQFGWKAIMVTDTAPYRNPHYHRPSDLPNTLNYQSMAHVVTGLEGVVKELSGL